MSDNKNEQFNKDYVLKNYTLGVQPDIDEISLIGGTSVNSPQKITNQELQKFKNSHIFSRVFNHLLAGATLGFYNPYKVSPDVAEQNSWFYKRWIRIPFVEDIISPYGISFAGLIEAIPLFAYGGLFKGLGSIGAGAGKVLSSGIRLSEQIGVKAVDKTAGFLASKIPQIETLWTSLSPQARKIGYEILKKDLQFSPWVAGATYREKMLNNEDASRVSEYLSALYNPVNLFMAGALTGIEARIATKGLIQQGKTFWEALGDIQKINDLRLPTIKTNIENMIKDGFVEKNPLAVKSLFSYARFLPDYLDNKSFIETIKKLNISDDLQKLITRDGLIDFLKTKIDDIPPGHFILSRILDDPVKFLREDIFSSVNKNLNNAISNYSSSLAKLTEKYVNFFDEFINKNDTVKEFLMKNNDILSILSKSNITNQEKVMVVDFFNKQQGLLSSFKGLPEIQNFIQDISNDMINVYKSIDNIAKYIKEIPEQSLLSLKNILLNNKYIIPVGESFSQITDNVVIPKEFIKSVIENMSPSSFVTPEGIKNLIRTRELLPFLKENMTPDNLYKLAKEYPTILYDDLLKLENAVEISKTHSVITEKISKDKADEIVNSVLEKQYFLSSFGIEKNEAVELAKQVNLLIEDSYSLIKKSNIYNQIDKEKDIILKNYFSSSIINRGLSEEEWFGPLEKFIFNLNLFKGDVINNINLATAKSATLVIDYLIDANKELYKFDIVNWFIGKKNFKEIEKTAKIIWNELKNFRLVKGSFSKSNFMSGLFDLYNKDYSNILSRESLNKIFLIIKNEKDEYLNIIRNVYTNSTPEEISKILENEAILRKNLLEDEIGQVLK